MYSWETTTERTRETARKVLGVRFAHKKDMETWRWNDKVQESIKRKRIVKQMG